MEQTMEQLQKDYTEAMHHVDNAIKTSDSYYWWPRIVGKEQLYKPHGRAYFIYEIGGGETAHGCSGSGNGQGHGHTSAMLRLIHHEQPCTLFACPIHDCIDETGHWKSGKEDIVVGFISGTQESHSITLAWKNHTCVCPMLGMDPRIPIAFDVPDTAKWVLCAVLDNPCRRAIALYCHATSTWATARQPEPHRDA